MSRVEREGAFKALAVVNNAISVRMLACALEKDGLKPEDVLVISARKLDDPWLDCFQQHLPYPAKPRQTLLGQWPFISFYRSAARLIKNAVRAPKLERIYLVNIENLLTNHLLLMASTRRDIEVVLVVEGIFNFQEITRRNRARWRWLAKPVLARLLGLQWRAPVEHLSGAFEPGIRRVVSFTDIGLKAPAEKIDLIAWQPVSPSVAPDPQTLIIVHTGLWQWMDHEAYLHVARAFVRWVEQQKFTRIIVKHHPHVAPEILPVQMTQQDETISNESVQDLYFQCTVSV